MKRALGITLIIISLVLITLTAYLNSRYSRITRTFSPYSMLTASWEKYKEKFINKDGRVIDFSANSVTTSEGQSYAMLRAVWMDDQKVFDRVWKFTKDNLKRPKDNLFGWRWGKNNNGSYGFFPEGGENAASDADSDIALALILAKRRWNQSSYEQEAKAILDDMWEMETATQSGKRYLTAGNWADQPTEIIINPSYFAPYAWRIFAEVDKKHDWNSLVDPAYELLNNAGKASLDTGKGRGLPPDWIAIDKATGELKRASTESLKTDYSFDAMRVPWRIALDYQWNQEQKALQYLESSFGLLSEQYKTRNKIPGAFTHAGAVLNDQENPVMYATALGYFMIADPEQAKKLYEEKIVRLYSNEDNTFKADLPYYEQNWLWFGLALYNTRLIKY